MTNTIDGKEEATAAGINRLVAEMTSDDERSEAKRLIIDEYGDSENFMTPNVQGYMMLGPNVAAEIATGAGLRRPDTGKRPMLVGTSIVERLDDGSTVRHFTKNAAQDGSTCLIAPSIEEVREKLKSLRERFA